jgi:hypothetical protein
MESPITLNLTLGDKTYAIQTLNLIQQRAIGSAMFSVKESKTLDDFDFDAEFDGAAAIVFAAVSLVEPEKDKTKWLAGIKITWRELQRAKAEVMRFAGYMPAATSAEGAAPGEPLPVAE